jgi:alpha-galactosidase
MKNIAARIQSYVCAILCFFLAGSTKAAALKPVKVFILAGQSNMQGQGEITKGDKGNLTWLVQHDQAGKYQHLIDSQGGWKIRDDVFVYTVDKLGVGQSGGLTVGFGAKTNTIGPELQFGNVVGDYFDGPVLIIKTAWGGKSLAVDFCPPDAAGSSGYEHIPRAPKDVGYYYVQMLATVHDVLDHLDKYVPGYQGQGYELAGFGWHQGWNDRINPAFNAAYETNLVHLIHDVRRDLGTPNLPFVIATTGMKGWKEKDPRALSLMKAQLAVTNCAEFKGNVAVVDTRDIWREITNSPSAQIYHWCRNAESYCLIGEAMGNAMLGLLQTSKVAPTIHAAAKLEDRILAPTPPMGWNSWNAFEKEIDETKIKEIADVMVSSGMRDAGYKYLVLDDAWMAAERNERGQLTGDLKKFPGGMKAVGDYIHSKGLKFGIYECRGHVTCQNLPGSFGHEQTDMNSFAEWGVDYIKMDSCHAAKNGRLSTEDFAIYRDAIKNTGRPMILSISDFGAGAWVWGGKNYAQLWRTSGDIYPTIKSVYECAETSGGDAAIHPAFKGLWQFAGPGHWNDPDMLQVGNLKSAVEDKVHFSLWCILAAPLMGGNDLRSMTDATKSILMAPEVIAVNQDPRGQQGYRVFKQGSLEIYNKPLADGTTTVLLLNKGQTNADLTVRWEQIGLKGRQGVRDLWAQKYLGIFDESFTAKNLAQHEHLLIKVGTPGSKPVAGPVPVPPEKYTVTRSGTTYLSDLYYIKCEDNPPVMDQDFNGGALVLNGQNFEKGLGCKSKSQVVYKLNGRADRFKALVGLTDRSPENKLGEFRVQVEDRFGGKVIFSSGKMRKGDKPVAVDIDVKGLDAILLEFTGKEVFGNWADARVMVNE